MHYDVFIIEPGSRIATLSKECSQALALQQQTQHCFRRHYLDSFDWRLFRAGYYFQADQHENSFLLKLYRGHDQHLVSQAHTMQLPRFSKDLAHSKLADILTPILDVRALVTQIETQTTQQCLRQTARANKLTAELYLEEIKPVATRQSIKYLRHIPVKGYDKENKAIAKFLSQNTKLTHTRTSILQLLVTQFNIDISYRSKPGVKLNSAARTDQQVKQLLLFFLSVMRSNEAGIIDDIDTEFTHDYRIAVRRSRTLLSQISNIIPQRSLNSFSKHLTKLGAITTPLRDFDVMLLNFDDYRNLLPRKLRADLDPALAFIRQERQVAYRQAVRYFKSKTYAGFCQRWENFLQTPAPNSTTLDNAKQPLKKVADKRTWKAYRKIIKQGLAITNDSPADDLHTLRKNCKKLRCLLEFFQNIYPKKKLKALINALKQLQNNLGEFQDIHVHIDFFKQLRIDMQAQTQLEKTTEQAIDEVIDALDKKQLTCRNKFHSHFKKFSAKTNQQLFKQLFRS